MAAEYSKHSRADDLEKKCGIGVSHCDMRHRTFMEEWERQRANWLCDEAANENDPVRFIQLTEEIVRILQRKEGEPEDTKHSQQA